MFIRPRLLIAALAFGAFNDLPAAAQFDTTPQHGAKLDKALTKKIKIGVSITAVGGPVRGMVGTIPVPTEWPEQQVRIVDEDVTPSVRAITYRMLDAGAKQMVISVPQLKTGEEAHAFITFEVTRHSLVPPDDTSIFHAPAKDKLPKELLGYLGISPYIETTHPKIVQLAKEVTAGKSGWEKVAAIYQATREKVEYKNGPLKGAIKALTDGTGDCEELTSLFVALCRASGIPARCVWVPEHCYPEFYLVDAAGNGYWFPCQAAGSEAFGGIPEHRPILQKGDNFRDPDRPKEKLRYVSEFLKGSAVKGGGQPRVQFVRDIKE